MIEFQNYARIKNNYCVCYFGYADEYLVQLRLLKSIIEQQFPGLNLCFGCKDDKTHLLVGCEPVLTISKIKISKDNFAHIRELGYNSQTHPVEDLLVESDVKSAVVVSNLLPRMTNKCVIITQGNYPTKPLTILQIERLGKMAQKENYEIEWDSGIEHASLVMGVESPQLFEAAGRGIHTTLVPTGIGTNLYNMMFPKGEIWSLFV